MANRFRGEISVVNGGTTYTLVLDMNALAQFEDATGLSALDMEKLVNSGSAKISHIRAIIHAALSAKHPDAPVSVAGDIMSDDMDIVQRLFEAASPPAPKTHPKNPGKKS